MKNNAFVRWIPAIIMIATLNIAACTDDATSPSTSQFLITQDQLDAAKIIRAPQDTAITGDPFSAFGSDTTTTLHKIRDLASNINNSASIAVGSVWVRRAYKYDAGKRGVLINDVVMVKREAGYYPDGGDFEYMNIPYDSTANYGLHPNGMLPAVSDTTHRGTGSKLQSCVNCHAGSGAGTDRIFSR